MSDPWVVALSGAFVGVLTALVTAWLNARAFRDQLGESKVLETQLEDCRAVWAEVSDTRHRALQVVLGISNTIGSRSQDESDDELRGRLNEEFHEERMAILRHTLLLDRCFVTLPGPVIDALTEYQNVVFDVLRAENWRSAAAIETRAESVLKEIRALARRLVARELPASEALGAEPSRYAAQYVKDALSL